jgi:protein SCO1/2
MKSKKYILIGGSILILGLLGFLYVIESNNQSDENRPIVVESVTQTPIKNKKYNRARDLVGQSIRTLPDTKLVTQTKTAFRFKSLPTTPVILSFIFTRCPDQQMCPLVTRKMARVQKEANSPVHLVSITMDPEYDTPKVLKQYAEGRNLDLTNWDFVTGPLSTIKTVEDQFHISVLRKNGSLKTHNMRTYLIDSEGVVEDVWTGSDWSPKTVISRLSGLQKDSTSNES